MALSATEGYGCCAGYGGRMHDIFGEFDGEPRRWQREHLPLVCTQGGAGFPTPLEPTLNEEVEGGGGWGDSAAAILEAIAVFNPLEECAQVVRHERGRQTILSKATILSLAAHAAT